MQILDIIQILFQIYTMEKGYFFLNSANSVIIEIIFFIVFFSHRDEYFCRLLRASIIISRINAESCWKRAVDW